MSYELQDKTWRNLFRVRRTKDYTVHMEDFVIPLKAGDFNPLRAIIQNVDQEVPLRIENTLSETGNKVIQFINQMRLLAERQMSLK